MLPPYFFGASRPLTQPIALNALGEVGVRKLARIIPPPQSQ